MALPHFILSECVAQFGLFRRHLPANRLPTVSSFFKAHHNSGLFKWKVSWKPPSELFQAVQQRPTWNIAMLHDTEQHSH